MEGAASATGMDLFQEQSFYQASPPHGTFHVWHLCFAPGADCSFPRSGADPEHIAVCDCEASLSLASAFLVPLFDVGLLGWMKKLSRGCQSVFFGFSSVPFEISRSGFLWCCNQPDLI